MSWITVIWSMSAAASLTLALMHFLIWCRDRNSWANLCFFVLAAGVIGMSAGEFGAMYANTPAHYGSAVRWGHFAYGFIALGSVGFVHFYFGTGKVWLLVTALGLRFLALIANFTTGLNLHIGSIQILQKVQFLGEQVSMLGTWTLNPWVRLGQIAALVQFVYVVDASLRLWRTGARESRRRALMVGGPLAFFILFSSAQAGLVAAGVLRMPMIVSFPFLAVLLAMSYELSGDALRASQLGRELRESEKQMAMATEAVNLGVWVRDLVRNEIWASETWRTLFGFSRTEPIVLEKLLQRIHPDDREVIRNTLVRATDGDGHYVTEYRTVLPDGGIRWIASRGRVELNGAGKPVLVRGVALDITTRKRAESESLRQREELAHLSRITIVSELSGALAHELNQPLAIILTNAQAAQRLLAQSPPDLAEARDILADIVSEDERAGEVIRRLRSFLKPGETFLQPLSANEILEDVLRITRSDLIGRGVTVHRALTATLPPTLGDRIQLQQVVLNLILNACDAMAGNPTSGRQLTLTTMHLDGVVRLSVSDIGCGLPPEPERVFEPFYTTKEHGLGLGLPICRSIITAHKGRLWAEARETADGGATFHIELPAITEAKS